MCHVRLLLSWSQSSKLSEVFGLTDINSVQKGWWDNFFQVRAELFLISNLKPRKRPEAVLSLNITGMYFLKKFKNRLKFQRRFWTFLHQIEMFFFAIFEILRNPSKFRGKFWKFPSPAAPKILILWILKKKQYRNCLITIVKKSPRKGIFPIVSSIGETTKYAFCH